MGFNNSFNYKNLYLKNYKKLPNYVFWANLVMSCLISILIGFIVADESDLPYGVFAAFVSLAVGVGLAFLARIAAAIIISQKVVSADALIALSENKSDKATVVDDLPDL